jgi:hypothetical protein
MFIASERSRRDLENYLVYKHLTPNGVKAFSCRQGRAIGVG